MILTPTLEALGNMRNPDPAELRDKRKIYSQVMGILVAKWFPKTTEGPTGTARASGPTSKTDGMDGLEQWVNLIDNARYFPRDLVGKSVLEWEEWGVCSLLPFETEKHETRSNPL